MSQRTPNHRRARVRTKLTLRDVHARIVREEFRDILLPVKYASRSIGCLVKLRPVNAT